MGNVSLTPLYAQSFGATSTKSASPHASVQSPLKQFDIHISIISNSHLLREALALLLQNHWSTNIVNSSTSAVDMTSTVTKSSNHIVLLDSGIGQHALVENIQEQRSLQPSPYIVVLELKDDPDLILSCIEAGAHGYALQSASSAEVIQVIEQVYRGVAHCSPEITAKLFARLTQSKTVQQCREKPALTCRELEVLQYVAQGYSDRGIATELVIEVRTVKHHVHNILRKLNVKYRRDAAQLAINNCWLKQSS
jgi:DNA-binding NarL/FixJ family response regulator